VGLPHVYILTWCKRIELLYGSTLVFNTLRDGFPSAPIHVVDAASIPDARIEISRKAHSCQAQFMQLDRRIELSTFIQHTIEMQRSGSAVFVDPDICFWQCVEDWQWTSLAAGRYIPRHLCEFTDCLSEPRLHTSLLWIADVARLRQKMAHARQSKKNFEPLRNVMVQLGGRWHYFDTAAGLYGLFPDEMQPFNEQHLNAYDHLFAGTYSDSVLKKLGPTFGPSYREIHRAAQQDYRTIRGCWRMQERYLQSRAALVEAEDVSLR